jgi:hypothetical protein
MTFRDPDNVRLAPWMMSPPSQTRNRGGVTGRRAHAG